MDNEKRVEPDYIEELVALIRSGGAESEIVQQCPALDEPNQEERRRLYHSLGVERVSEIFAYLDDPGKYIEELELERAADIIENMDADDAVDILEEMDEEIRNQLIELINEDSKEEIRALAISQRCS